MRSPDEVIWCLPDILVTASPSFCPLKSTNHRLLLPMSLSTPFHRPIKGKDLLVPSQMMCARAFHDSKFNSRAADVTTWRDPQVSLFLTILCWLHPNPALAQPTASWYRVATWWMALYHWFREGKHLTFGQHLTTWPLAEEWGNVTLFMKTDFVYVYNLEELCPVLWWLHPDKKEGVCPDDHHGALRLWCPIQSVPWGNRDVKPAVCEGPFLRRKSLNIPGGLRCLWKREVAPDTPKEV